MTHPPNVNAMLAHGLQRRTNIGLTSGGCVIFDIVIFMTHSPDVRQMLAHGRRRRTNIGLTSGGCVIFDIVIFMTHSLDVKPMLARRLRHGINIGLPSGGCVVVAGSHNLCYLSSVDIANDLIMHVGLVSDVL